MKRRPALATALLLLGSTALTAFAHPTTAMNGVGGDRAAGTPLGSMAIARSYFDALDHQGYPGRDYRALHRLYAHNVTLTESLTTGQPRSHTGLRQMRAFDRWNVLEWSVTRSEQVSPSVVLTVEMPSIKGPGHEGQAERWLTLFTVRNGKILNLVWMAS